MKNPPKINRSKVHAVAKEARAGVPGASELFDELTQACVLGMYSPTPGGRTWKLPAGRPTKDREKALDAWVAAPSPRRKSRKTE